MTEQICQTIMDGLLGQPIEFLKNNLLLTPSGAEGPPVKQLRMFDASEYKQLSLSKKCKGKIYQIQEKNEGHLIAHYLPFGFDAGYYIILNANSPFRIMFTAVMTGCSVGYVMAGDGSVRFHHYNISDVRDQEQSLSFAKKALHPSQYREQEQIIMGDQPIGRGCVTTVGVKGENGKWRFYYQLFRAIGGSYYEIIRAKEL